ncbi:MAG: phosphoribosylanthranilate isomerase [Thiopseudomonas sp.]|nr:phosphoribosylanthranilate isomerase [Thiopseudomonas sp.]MCK9465231.1 phosphoribosylanthranilate isomerase [Thiopseudomonas sp.]
MMRTRVKVCGITNIEDALAAAHAGADAIGLVFYAKSPRAVTAEQAAKIIAALPPFVTTVALFVDAPVEDVQQVLQQVPIDLLQFHGDESPEFCVSFQRPYIKALRMQPGIDITQQANMHRSALGILLDAWVPGVPGGTGQTFNWNDIPSLAQPLVLAGGLTPDNVQQAITQVNPWAVDVSGGLEMSKGRKDHAKVQAFMQAVNAV